MSRTVPLNPKTPDITDYARKLYRACFGAPAPKDFHARWVLPWQMIELDKEPDTSGRTTFHDTGVVLGLTRGYTDGGIEVFLNVDRCPCVEHNGIPNNPYYTLIHELVHARDFATTGNSGHGPEFDARCRAAEERAAEHSLAVAA